MALMEWLLPPTEAAKNLLFDGMDRWDRKFAAKRATYAAKKQEELFARFKQRDNEKGDEAYAEGVLLRSHWLVFGATSDNNGVVPNDIDKIIVAKLSDLYRAPINIEHRAWKRAFEMFKADTVLSKLCPSLSGDGFISRLKTKNSEYEIEQRKRREGQENEKPIVDEISRLRKIGEEQYRLSGEAAGIDTMVFAKHIFAFERVQREINHLKGRLIYSTVDKHWVDDKRTG